MCPIRKIAIVRSCTRASFPAIRLFRPGDEDKIECMRRARRQRVVSSLLCIALLALSGLGPALRHAHADDATPTIDRAAGKSIALMAATTHWHINWFGVEITLADDAHRSAPAKGEIVRTWQAAISHSDHGVANHASRSAIDAVANVPALIGPSLEAGLQFGLDGCALAANFRPSAPLVTVLRI